MSTQPNQGKGNNPDQDSYSGYAGYKPRKPADDPYGASYQPGGNQKGGTADAGSQPSDPNYVYGQQQGQQYRSSNASSGQQQQQQQTYQPPSSVTGKRYGSSGQASSSQASTGLKPNQAAALSYLGVCFTGLFFFFWGRNNRLVRFSAAQSIVLFLPLLIIFGILNAISSFIAPIWLIGWFIAWLLSLVSGLGGFVAVILWLYLMFQAYRGVEVKLPFVGEYAEKLVRMFSPRQKKSGY